ncbi:PepSY domain-containing protein [Planctomycetota bacterium]|nr:PepSY domain-containing protein [Planctomycetota bacterium]
MTDPEDLTGRSSRRDATAPPPGKSRAPKLNRRLHRVGALVSALPVLVVVVSGLFLQLKKDWSFVQPPTVNGSTAGLEVDWDTILAGAASVEEAGIKTWDDVDRLDVRPGKGMLKVRGKNRWEVQLDAASGEVLQASYRRSDLIESIHDGSFFAESVKLWVFLPAAIILLGLWISGVYLWLLPHLVRRRRRA